MALTYCSSRDSISVSCDPQIQLTDSLMGFIVEQIETPGFDMAPLLKPVPTTRLNVEQKPVPVPGLNFTPFKPPSIHSLHQDPICSDIQNSDPANVKCAPHPNHNQFVTSSLTNPVNFMYQNPSFSVAPCTGSLTNPVNFVYQNPSFPVGPCTGTDQGMVVPAVKSAAVQNVAARVRRKKISEKTHELARLIPGGTRVNTAEMLQAAFKYVKFLQAQIGILAMMDSKEAREVPLMVEEYMRVSLDSTNIQEYLCAQGKCLVPKKLAMNLTEEMKSSVLVSRDLSRFLESIGS